MTFSATPVLVMGMHRSGTSCVTGLLEAYGISLGPRDALMPATNENPLGYFEHLDFNRICIDLLASAGADWWKISAFDVAKIPAEALSKARMELARLIAELDRAPAYALKDPRFCLLLPLLRSSFSSPVFVHVVRSPIEVAMSLNVRNGIGLAEGIALWEAYNRAALKATENEPRLLLNYRKLVENPQAEGLRLRQGLADLGVQGLAAPAQVDASDFVLQDLYRQREGDDAVSRLLTGAQEDLWRSLESGVFPSIDETDDDSRLRAVLLSSLETQYEVRAAEVSKGNREKELGDLRSAVESHGARLTELAQRVETEWAVERRNIASLTKELSDTCSEVRSVSQGYSETAELRRDFEKYMLEARLYRAELRKQRDASIWARIGRLRLKLERLWPLHSDGKLRNLASRIDPDFDEAYYLLQNPDVAASGHEALLHYLRYGWKEGRVPHPDIDNATLLRRYPEIKAQE